jgi:sigma-B regulation protein RsbU (phosphoserine phosphatase)
MAYDRQSDRFLDFDTGGIPLGVFGDTTYEEQAFHGVQTGQIYFAGTDGVWETRNEADGDFGKERVRQLIRRYSEFSATEISERLREELTRFRGGSTPDDDVTFVIVKVTESPDGVKE